MNQSIRGYACKGILILVLAGLFLTACNRDNNSSGKNRDEREDEKKKRDFTISVSDYIKQPRDEESKAAMHTIKVALENYLNFIESVDNEEYDRMLEQVNSCYCNYVVDFPHLFFSGNHFALEVERILKDYGFKRLDVQDYAVKITYRACKRDTEDKYQVTVLQKRQG